ncbi:MAG: hypothetical protein IKS61_01925, partial [Aeriscardovia sp.]|nr:hypothetical protein [Aeriscardovia sp.]
MSTSTSSTTSKQTSSPNPPDSLLEKTTSTYPWFDYPGFVNFYSSPSINIKNWNSAQGALQVRVYLPAGTVFSYQYAQNQPSQGFDPPFTSDSAIKSYFDNAMSEGSVGSNGIEIQNSNGDGIT